MTTRTRTSPSASASPSTSRNSPVPPPPPRPSPPPPPGPPRDPRSASSGEGVAAAASTMSMSNGFANNGYHGTVSVPAAEETKDVSKPTPTPLKAAADLIQKLDIAHTQVTNSAADAARECETARNNARAAQEICRRYSKRSFPKLKSTLWDTNAHSNDDDGGGGGYDDDYRPRRMVTTASFRIDSRSTSSSSSRYEQRRTASDRSYRREHEEEFNESMDDRDPNLSSSSKRTPWKSPTTSTISKGRVATPKTPLSAGSKSTTTRLGAGLLQTPSSVDIVTQHHAEDMMQLQLELEKTKQELRSERRLHEECKGDLATSRSRATSLEDENQSLRLELQQKEEHDTTLVPQLQEELEKARSQLLQAEEDADMAVAFATEGEKERSELATSLELARQEIQQLKRQLLESSPRPVHLDDDGKRHVHFADETSAHSPAPPAPPGTPYDPMGVQPMETDTPHTTASNATPSKSMVAAGRQILFRDNKVSKSPTGGDDTVVIMERSPAKSAERRRRLNECLNNSSRYDGALLPTPTRLTMSPARPTGPAPPSSSSTTTMAVSTPGPKDGGPVSIDDNLKKKLDEYSTAAKVLQLSGYRLRLDGVWFKHQNHHHHHHHDNTKSAPIPPPIHLDAMARQYCQSAEYKIDQQDKEITKLEALCDLMEKQLLQ